MFFLDFLFMNINSALFGIGFQQKLFNFAKIFVLRLFEMVANQKECSRLKQKSLIKFLLTKKCKRDEIYRRPCYIHRETFFTQKAFTNGLNMGLSLWTWVKKTVHGEETHWFSSKEKVQRAVISKEGNVEGVLGHEKTHHYWFPWKRCYHKQSFLLPTPF